MADDWGSTTGAGTKKRNPWLWGCGLGCLGVLLVVGVLAYMGVSWFRSALDPDVAFQNMTEHLPTEQLPAGWEVVFGNDIPFVDMQVTVIQRAAGEDGPSVLASVFVIGNQEQADSHWNEIAPSAGSSRSVEVQGRTLTGHSNTQEGDGAKFLVMVSEEGETPVIMIEFQRQNSSTGVTDAEVQAFFNPFSIGPDGPYSLPKPEPDLTTEADSSDPAEDEDDSVEQSTEEESDQ